MEKPDPTMAELLRKLNGLSLTVKERELMNAILTIARDITDGKTDPLTLSEEFASSFTPKTVELIKKYVKAPLDSRITENAPVSALGVAHPAGISKTSIGANSTENDDNGGDKDEESPGS